MEGQIGRELCHQGREGRRHNLRPETQRQNHCQCAFLVPRRQRRQHLPGQLGGRRRSQLGGADRTRPCARRRPRRSPRPRRARRQSQRLLGTRSVDQTQTESVRARCLWHVLQDHVQHGRLFVLAAESMKKHGANSTQSWLFQRKASATRA